MAGASLEDTLDLWSAVLPGIKERIRPLFAAPSVAASLLLVLGQQQRAHRRHRGRDRGGTVRLRLAAPLGWCGHQRAAMSPEHHRGEEEEFVPPPERAAARAGDGTRN